MELAEALTEIVEYFSGCRANAAPGSEAARRFDRWMGAAEIAAAEKEAAPALFRQAGPGCVRGRCPEARPCGKPRREEDEECG